eukprot:CAMPEP_0177595528 /NCGR_PEP_ID=MMETSP0419_2-20121207/10417_1 /TAXON_ID=582737 /ORGANISM="Tetraselmis sp., Strain GSL018" /LENGTH=324 /DNA_ID=CAMNT_0019087019 /DNA_START=52 /DNA_END=1029 /DNA_ORIENTATION=-
MANGFGSSETECRDMADYAFSWSPFVRFMVEKLQQAGCTVDSKIAKIRSCDSAVVGGFAPGVGVVLCHNHLGTQDEVNRSLTHELIHAYDHCRGANLDWSDCHHHACSEKAPPEGSDYRDIKILDDIRGPSEQKHRDTRASLEQGHRIHRKTHYQVRAANLSGDCHWSQEFLRGNFSLQAQHQACVRRRALLSVAMNPNCPEPKAKEAVDAVFDTASGTRGPSTVSPDRLPECASRSALLALGRRHPAIGKGGGSCALLLRTDAHRPAAPLIGPIQRGAAAQRDATVSGRGAEGSHSSLGWDLERAAKIGAGGRQFPDFKAQIQ